MTPVQGCSRVPWHIATMRRTRILLLILLLPACLSGLRDTHDWGDDFAQYLVQAKELAEGATIRPAHAVANWQTMGPAPKGIAYSLLLAPVYRMSGMQVRPFLLLNAVLLLLWCFAVFRYMQPGMDRTAAFLVVLLMAYDRHVLALKSEILPELLLATLVMWGLLLLRPDGKRGRWWLAAVLGAAVLVKSAGWVLYLTVLVTRAWRHRKRDGDGRRFLAYMGPVTWLPPVLSVVAELGLARSGAWGAAWYAGVFTDTAPWTVIAANAASYAETLRHWFEPELPAAAIPVVAAGALVCVLVGVVERLRRDADAGDLLAGAWLLLLLCYPYTSANDRFLIPILPLLLRYLVAGMAAIARLFRWRGQGAVPAMLGAFLLLHIVTVRVAITQGGMPVKGPWDHAAQEAFAEIGRQAHAEMVIGSTKPWVVHLFTGRTALWMGKESADRRPDMLLLGTDPQDPGYYDHDLLQRTEHDPRWERSWANDRFALFQRRQEDP